MCLIQTMVCLNLWHSMPFPITLTLYCLTFNIISSSSCIVCMIHAKHRFSVLGTPLPSSFSGSAALLLPPLYLFNVCIYVNVQYFAIKDSHYSLGLTGHFSGKKTM